ncbi:hypothetical protein [Kitasatospora paranensis]|jgi:hypothetical protein|uniref:Uncharacterized protein n=1 Tax=Kitasatospora paranensis TaxID=258053 RepID=A0ABW2FVW1_9ACTN
MLKKFASVVLLAAAASAFSCPAPAFADGPKTPEEAAICAQLLAWAMPTGLTPTSIDAVCTVKNNSNG